MNTNKDAADVTTVVTSPAISSATSSAMSSVNDVSNQGGVQSASASDDLKFRCDMAWRALAQDRPDEAVEALAPLAALTVEDEEVARVWCAMMGWVDDLGHVERELRRLARVWATTPQVVAEMARVILRAWSRCPGPSPFASRESLIGLGVDVIDLCLSDAPPSKPAQRAELYLSRAALLTWVGPLGDDRALKDLEVALSLEPESAEGWFTLGRLHLARGRWEKAALATERALELNFDPLRGGWNLAVALTAAAPTIPDGARPVREAWTLAAQEEFADHALTDTQGRLVARDLPRQLVALHSQMLSPDRGWDLEREWSDETVWVQPLSPCHGRVIHPTDTSQPADLDDLIIWDPQPTRFERVGGEERPILLGLATLERGRAITRPLPRPALTRAQLDQLNDALPNGVLFHQSERQQLAQDNASTRSDERSPEPAMSGKLCWPQGSIAVEIARAFEQTWRSLNLPEV